MTNSDNSDEASRYEWLLDLTDYSPDKDEESEWSTQRIAERVAHTQMFGTELPLETLDGPMVGLTQHTLHTDWSMWLGYEPGQSGTLLRECCAPGVEPGDEKGTIWIGHYVFDPDEEALVWCPSPAYDEWVRMGQV